MTFFAQRKSVRLFGHRYAISSPNTRCSAPFPSFWSIAWKSWLALFESEVWNVFYGRICNNDNKRTDSEGQDSHIAIWNTVQIPLIFSSTVINKFIAFSGAMDLILSHNDSLDQRLVLSERTQVGPQLIQDLIVHRLRDKSEWK